MGYETRHEFSQESFEESALEQRNEYTKISVKQQLSKKTEKLVFKTNYRLMQVKRAFCNTFDLHYTPGKKYIGGI